MNSGLVFKQVLVKEHQSGKRRGVPDYDTWKYKEHALNYNHLDAVGFAETYQSKNAVLEGFCFN